MSASTYIVKAQYGRFVIENSSFLAIFIPAGGSAIFDQSDSSNTGHPIKISTTRDGTHASGSEYTTGVVVTGTAGSAGAKVQFTPETDGIYYYYCGNHPNMGSSISFIKTVFTDLGATAYDADEGDLTSSIKKEIYKGSELLATITSPHVNPWEVANISLPPTATENASYTIKYNVTDASSAVAQEYIKNININIITTNLDLPDDPEPEEFVAANSSTRWRIQTRSLDVSTEYGASNLMWREMLIKYEGGSSELGDYGTTQSSNGRYYFWVPEFEYGDGWGPQDSTSALKGLSNLFSNRRFLNKNGMDLFFPFGIYKPMNDNAQKVIYANQSWPEDCVDLTNRHGTNISDYVDSVIPVYNHDGTAGTDPNYSQFTTVSQVSDPPAYDDAEYSMTFDGFDADLWQFSTTMVPGFRYKSGGGAQYYMLGQSYELWYSRSFAKNGVYDDTVESGQTPLAVAAGLELENNPHLEFDGYMYYRGNQTTTTSSDAPIGDAIYAGDSHDGTTYRRFTYDIARKPLNSDHTLKTVADALKERRSNRTVTKNPAYSRRSEHWIDGAVKKFQSGEWYYPSNSPMTGTNFDTITASAPYVVAGKQFQNRYYFAKDFTIGST